jgi:hypothetical protein
MVEQVAEAEDVSADSGRNLGMLKHLTDGVDRASAV